MSEEDSLQITLSEILIQLEATNEVVHNWERQRMHARDIITNALMADIHLGKKPNYRKVLYRLADVLNVAILPSLTDVIEREWLDACKVEEPHEKRIHDLENALLSYRDFLRNPTIAGDTFTAMSVYANALHKRTEKLMGDDEE